ncbi:hypothetical protein [Antribacter gilvus]|uniref:hypothetical protein n=1 Tax=Antribacter gilvus TaxID=2304675 RepID=UPI000F7938A9|nr:hypothetical protein [Antribacter gilvus]
MTERADEPSETGGGRDSRRAALVQSLETMGWRLTVPGLANGWVVVLDPVTEARFIKWYVPTFLKRLETWGITELPGRPYREGLEDELIKLGIARIYQQADGRGAGTVVLTLEGQVS